MNLFLWLARTRFHYHHWKYDDIRTYDLGECFGVPPEVIAPITRLILDEPHLLGLEPIQGAVEVLTRFSRHEPLVFVTARDSCAPIASWMKQVMRDADPMSFVIETTGAGEAKPEVLKRLGVRYFVEDRIETCFLLPEHDIVPIVFEQPWNSVDHPFPRVRTWDELADMIVCDEGYQPLSKGT